MVDYDLEHQIETLLEAQDLSDAEMITIYTTLADTIKSYEQVVEVSLRLGLFA